MSQNNPPNNDSRLAFPDYWERHKLAIANDRKWECHGYCGIHPQCYHSCQHKKARLEAEGTLHNYDRYIRLVSPYLPGPISEVTLVEVCTAINIVRRKYNYSAGTATTIFTAVRRVYAYAEAHGDAVDVTRYIPSKNDIPLNLLVLLGSDRSEDYIREELRKERERLSNITKSFTVWQLEQLSSILWDHIEGDGRYCLLCLMLYAGVRPAEGRALRWKDIVPFVDYPNREIINVYNIRDADGNLKPLLKTDNAYRRIPVHIELQAYLAKRRAYVLAHADGPIDDLPICCYGNDFGRPCRDYEAAALAQKAFKDIKLSETDMYAYQIECLAEAFDSASSEAEHDQHLTLYVLRRNYWTWLQSSTRLSDVQKRLIMGHDLPDGYTRKALNSENILWDICLLADNCIISLNRHDPLFDVDLVSGKTVNMVDQGLCRLHINNEMLAAGVDLVITATTEEAGEAIYLKPLKTSSVNQLGVSLTSRVSGEPPRRRPGINCQYELLQAHLHPTSPSKRAKESKDNKPSKKAQ